MQGADKALDLRAADDIVGRVALGLNIDPGETEGVLVDDSIDATVATATDPACTLLDTAVAHRHQDVEDGLFEEPGACRAKPLDQLCGNLGA